jgi:hypothetical protein
LKLAWFAALTWGCRTRYNSLLATLRRTFGGELGSTGWLKCGWRAVVDQWAT